jgi:hypothetical protein
MFAEEPECHFAPQNVAVNSILLEFSSAVKDDSTDSQLRRSWANSTYGSTSPCLTLAAFFQFIDLLHSR